MQHRARFLYSAVRSLARFTSELHALEFKYSRGGEEEGGGGRGLLPAVDGFPSRLENTIDPPVARPPTASRRSPPHPFVVSPFPFLSTLVRPALTFLAAGDAERTAKRGAKRNDGNSGRSVGSNVIETRALEESIVSPSASRH